MELKNSVEVITNLNQFHSFEINGTHVKKLLQDSIYSNKNIFMQELPSNAYDSIVRRYGEKAPELGGIVVVFDKDRDEVVIKDNGTGISKSAFLELYRVYGNSDKRGSNSEIGCYGIGSKSPLAMTDSFIIESWSMEDGKYYKVLVTFDGITFLEECGLSDGRCGCEIRIPYQFDKSATWYNNDAQDVLQRTVRFWRVSTKLYAIAGGRETLIEYGFEDFDRYAKKLVRDSNNFEHIDNQVVNAYLTSNSYSDSYIFLNGIEYYKRHYDTSISGYIFVKKPAVLDLTANRESIADNAKYKKFQKFLCCLVFNKLYGEFKKGRINFEKLEKWCENSEIKRMFEERTKLLTEFPCISFSVNSDGARLSRRVSASTLVRFLSSKADKYYSCSVPMVSRGQKFYMKQRGGEFKIAVLGEELLECVKNLGIALPHYSEIPEIEGYDDWSPPILVAWRSMERKWINVAERIDGTKFSGTIVFVGDIYSYKPIVLGDYWFVYRKSKRTIEAYRKAGFRCLTEDEFYEEIKETELHSSRGVIKAKDLARHKEVLARCFVHDSTLEGMKKDEKVVVRIPPYSEKVFEKFTKLNSLPTEYSWRSEYYETERKQMLKELPGYFSVLGELNFPYYQYAHPSNVEKLHKLYRFVESMGVGEQ